MKESFYYGLRLTDYERHVKKGFIVLSERTYVSLCPRLAKKYVRGGRGKVVLLRLSPEQYETTKHANQVRLTGQTKVTLGESTKRDW